MRDDLKLGQTTYDLTGTDGREHWTVRANGEGYDRLVCSSWSVKAAFVCPRTRCFGAAAGPVAPDIRRLPGPALSRYPPRRP
jgi:hypothetical protein